MVQSLDSIEDIADVKAADCVQAELAVLSDVSSQSEVKELLPTSQHIHTTSPTISLSQVSGSQLLLLLHLFNGLFSITTWVSWYQKGETSLDLNDTRDDGVLGWKWHQLNHMQIIWHQHLHSIFAGCRLDALPDAQPAVSKH